MHTPFRSRPLVQHLVAACLLAAGASAMAQTAAGTVQRDINQQTRIVDGLQDGSLTTREAARLERDQARVDRVQSQALRDGQLSAAERQRLDHAQDRASQNIYGARHNDATGNPDSASSQRMQVAAKRDVLQNRRIENGIQQGQLSNREVAALQRGQARSHAQQAHQGSDGHVSAGESARRAHLQDRQSRHIHRARHNDVPRKS